ncbi:hypothetical protein [Arthrobacter sp. lap29]|uniref:hypothetical protein n=1 Tax=Arthrobacter sp. lap29 TaxID=3056122 RepID=UPI0037C18C5D
MKSYGRAPTFLLATGYEQVRSIAAALAGDRTGACTVKLQLPESGVCSTDLGNTCDAPATSGYTPEADSCAGTSEPVSPALRCSAVRRGGFAVIVIGLLVPS